MKQAKNTISVVIPVYNVKEYIDDCMQSIRSQSYEDLEIILVDDGSTDGSGLICDMYAQQDNRVTVIHQKNQGVSFARNTGLRHVNGDYIAFIDSDDIIVDKYFETLKKSIDENGADVAKCDIERFITVDDVLKVDTSIKKPMVKNSKQDLLDVLYCRGQGNWGGPGAKLYRASLLGGMNFDTSMAYDEDFDFLCRALKKANKINTIQFKGYMYRERPGSAMQSGFKKQMLESIEKRLKEIDNDTDIAKAQYTNILLNALYRFSLISTNTKKFGIEQDRLWQIILELRSKAALDLFQRIDHKASTFASYLGKRFLGRVVRTAKKINIAPEA